jgi:hypothetical protein
MWQNAAQQFYGRNSPTFKSLAFRFAESDLVLSEM